ncbi:hypothetical protein ACIBVL_31480 [Streptomyces sp. NPDC049687]|uniref:hypothetical protein n=1 Tax=Streptomyces sp. NPDC049687 TaxID=3365596 RepID=UPI0037AB0ED2
MPSLAAHTSALEVARGIAEQEEQARTHFGTAAVSRRSANRPVPRAIRPKALTLCTALGSPRAEEVRRTLQCLGSGPPEHG